MDEENGEKRFISCSECNQECCRNVIVQIDEPETEKDWGDVKWQVAHENVRVIKDNCGDWCIEFVTGCTHQAADGKCMIYEKRPSMCRGHEAETCIINGEGSYYDVILNSIKDVEKFLEENPEAIQDETVEVHTCPQCKLEFTDDDEASFASTSTNADAPQVKPEREGKEESKVNMEGKCEEETGNISDEHWAEYRLSDGL